MTAPDLPAVPGSTDEVAAISAADPSSASPSPKVRLERLFSYGQGPTTDEPEGTVRPSVLHELVLLLGRELQARAGAGDADTQALAVQLALLIWDGCGRPDVAVSLLRDSDHPVAHALRLQAAIDDAQPDAALRMLAGARRTAGAVATGASDDAELGELMLFLATRSTAGAAAVLDAYAMAADLLAKGGEPRLRALALTLVGKPAAAATVLETSDDPNDLVWAADLHLLGLPALQGGLRTDATGKGAVAVPAAAITAAVTILDRVCAQAAGSDGTAAGGRGDLAPPYAVLSAMERLHSLALDPRLGGRTRRGDVLRRRFEFLGGQAALTDGSEGAEGAVVRVELLGTALQLAGQLAEGAEPGSAADAEAASLYDAVAQFCARHRDVSTPLGRYTALLESARLYLRRGELAAAADRYQTLGHFLVDLYGGRTALLALQTDGTASAPSTSEGAQRLDRRAVAAALTYFGRASELLERDSRDAVNLMRAATLLGRISELGCVQETLVLRRLRVLLPSGHDGQAEAMSALVRLAEHAARFGDAQTTLRLLSRASRAAEALRIPGGDAYDLQVRPLPIATLTAGNRRDLAALARRCRRRGDHPQLVQVYRELGRPVPATAGTGVAAAGAIYAGAAVALSLNLTDDNHVDDDLLALQAAADTWSPVGSQLGAAASSTGAGGAPQGSLLIDATRFLVRQRQGFGSLPSATLATVLVEALNTLLSRVRHADTQAQLFRQLGHHAAEVMADLALAERCYQQVLSRRPDDVMALHALARLLQQRGEPERAVVLLQQAVEAALRTPQAGPMGLPPILQPLAGTLPGPATNKPTGDAGAEGTVQVGAQAAALLCCELGTLYEHLSHMQTQQTGAVDQAVACYSEALRRDPRCRPAARGLVALYRTMGRPREMLSAMERLLPLLRDEQQRLTLLLEMGEVATNNATGRTSDVTPNGNSEAESQAFYEQAVRAYSDALRLQPHNGDAIGRFVDLCRRTGRHALMAEVLQRAPRTVAVLDALRAAYEELGNPQALAAVSEELLAQLLAQPELPRAEVMQATRTLAELYQRLGRAEDEARAWERLYELAPDELLRDVPALLILEKRYGQSGRHAEQTALLTRAIEQLAAEQTQAEAATAGTTPSEAMAAALSDLRDRRRVLLLRLGDVQRDFLGSLAQATATFEQVLREWPADPTALRALAGLYSSPGMPGAAPERAAEQRRVLSALLGVTTDPAERSRLLQHMAEADEKQGNVDEAFKNFGQAFFLDPSNRAAFTAYERLCYLRKQWTETIRIYETALKLIETQKTRSYRPADLHLRRGQVLLQYLQQTDEALPCYLRALESDAENDSTQATLESIYASRNQWRELLSVYDKRASLVREDIKRVEILRRAARVATAKLRDVAEAVRFYEKLHAVDPTDSDALDALESHYERSRDNEKLYNLLGTRVALSVDEQQIIALNMRIGVLCEEGLRDHDRAIQAYRHVIEVQPTHREALDAMARLFEANERWAELIDVTRRQIRLVTDRAQKALLYFKCGSVTEAKFGKDDDAIRYYEAAVRTSAACLPALHSLRDIYIRREDWTRVTQTLELESKLWTEDKERAGILAHIGQIFLDRLGNQARAIEFFEQAISVDKDSMPANRALFTMYFQRGDWERALAASQVLLQKASREGEPSERSEFHRKRAIVALRLGHLRSACDSVTAALEVYPENLQVLELLVTLGRRSNLPYDFGPLSRELEKQYRRRDLPYCLARVLCAQAAMVAPTADIETAESLLREAVRLAPRDYLPSEALAGLYERLRRFDDSRATLEQFVAAVGGGDRADAATGAEGPHGAAGELRARALLRLSEICSVGMMDGAAALAVLRSLLGATGGIPAAMRRDARFRCAQELFALARYGEAREELDALIEESSAAVAADGTAREAAASNDELARYHHYQGRILEMLREDAAAQRAYRRSVDLAPAYAHPVVALARTAARAGDRAQADLLLRDALEQLGRRAAGGGAYEMDVRDEELRLRRAIAQLQASIEPKQAAETYRQIIAMATGFVPSESLVSRSPLDESGDPRAAWETLDDRIALADLLLNRLGNPGEARQEVMRVLARDLRNVGAYPLLSAICEQTGQPTRGERVRAVLSLLGYAGAASDRRTAPRLFALRQAINEEQRAKNLLPWRLAASPFFELLSLLQEAQVLPRMFPSPWPLGMEGESEPQPASRLWDPAFKLAIGDAQRLFGIDVDVYFMPSLPGHVLPLEAPAPGGRPIVVLDNSVMERADAERRFLLGRAFEALRVGYAFLLRLSTAEQAQWVRLYQGLLAPIASRDPSIADFVAGLPRPMQARLDRLASAVNQVTGADGTAVGPQVLNIDPQSILQALPQVADRAGLVFCDDVHAAVRMMARSQGEELAVVEGHGGGILLGQVAGGAGLVRYYLSDKYHDILAAIQGTTRL